MIRITVNRNNNQIVINSDVILKRTKIITFPSDGNFSKIIDVLQEVLIAIDDVPNDYITLEEINEDTQTIIGEW